MELHSYAKRRVCKKWTLEQKRKLVSARINYDIWFNNKPLSSLVPWKKILNAAKLDDFNVYFVRKQWSNMVAKYKQYKQYGLGDVSTRNIDEDMVRRLTDEWEFFQPIHDFMIRRTTNLHSYALTHKFNEDNNDDENTEEDNDKQLISTDIKSKKILSKLQTKHCTEKNISNNIGLLKISNSTSTTSLDQCHYIGEGRFHETSFDKTDNVTSSRDSNSNDSTIVVRNTDHDFYSKRSISIGSENQLSQNYSKKYIADDASSEDMQDYMMVDSFNTNQLLNQATKTETTYFIDSNAIKEEFNSDPIIKEELPFLQEFTVLNQAGTSVANTFGDSRPTSSTQPNKRSSFGRSERDKYYRHKRRFNRRLEKRFDAILQVMGQIVKAEYPNIDVTPLVGILKSNTMEENMTRFSSSNIEDITSENDLDLNTENPNVNMLI